MAVITRRTWQAIETETIRRLAGQTQTGFSLRVDHWLWNAYRMLTSTYHFFELDKEDVSLTIASGANTLALPADCFAMIAMTLRVSGAQVGEVQDYSFSALRSAYTATAGQPSRRSRFAGKLYFDVKADKSYDVDLYYYRTPADPDFASGSAFPETSVDVDEHIIEGACRFANPAIGRPDLGDVDRQLLTEWLAQQVRPALVAEPLEARERTETGRTLGGMQG